ncbi:MAG: c-type cytochrome [Alphaproteobacteria bacterium]|nr:c-type cytochrome [Alphaproteobacteria bacterium]
MSMTGRRSVVVALLALAAFAFAGPAFAAGSAERGAYIFQAAGCKACHTDEKGGGGLLAGGAPLITPFGTFYPPNITPDPNHGIGAWSEADFVTAVTAGVSPDGSNYYPAFPYTSYTKMAPQDAIDLWAYIQTVPAADVPDRPHELDFPFSWRFLLTFWRWLYFDPGAFVPDPGQSEAWNRGAYLVQALAHCSECHTPRGFLGGFESDKYLAGNRDGPEGERVPNITPDPETGIGDWSTVDITFMLRTGILPDGDVVGSVMSRVVRDDTSKLTDDDLKAIAAYLMAVPPVVNVIAAEPSATE